VNKTKNVVEKGVAKRLSGNEYRHMWYIFKKRKVSMIGLVIVFLYVFIAIFANQLTPYGPLDQELSKMLQPPSAQHLLGTDELGRDILSRIIFGSRLSLQVGFTTVGIALAFGVPLGIISGYFGGKVDMFIMRLFDILMAFPGVILAISLVAIMGPSLRNAMIAIGIYTLPHFARQARAETLSIKSKEFIEASKALGASNTRIIVDHVLVNIISPLIVLGTLNFANAILVTAGLGFLGLGAQPPTPEWGAMLSSGRKYLSLAPHVCTYPGLAIFFLVLGLNLLGDGIRDVFDPKMKD
jgi:peptide/nickel transport system permease protein